MRDGLQVVKMPTAPGYEAISKDVISDAQGKDMNVKINIVKLMPICN